METHIKENILYIERIIFISLNSQLWENNNEWQKNKNNECVDQWNTCESD